MGRPFLPAIRPTFRFTLGDRSSSRLADVVGPGSVFATEALAARMLALLPTEPDETPYLGVSCVLVERGRLEPDVVGDVGDAAIGGVASAPASNAEVQPSPRSPREAVGVVRRALAQAVARTLGDARRVAVMTGGGLDSSGLLALALEWAKPRGASVFAVALDYAAVGDDRPYLRMLEESLGCEVQRVVPEDGARHLGCMDGVDAAPFCWPSGPMEIEMMARARREGAECVLMGVGGDEIFDGEPQALAEVARRGEIVRAVRAARSLRGFERPRSRTVSWLLRPLVGRFTPSAVRIRMARRTRPWFPAWAGPSLRRYLASVHARDLDVLAQNLPSGIVVDPKRAERHRANIAWLRHQEEIAAGIERRDPYLDRELTRTVAGLPPEWLLDGGIRRGLFRAALRGALPDALVDREDKAYFEPAFARMARAAGGLDAFRELATGRELAALGLVDTRRFREAFETFVAQPEDGWAWMSIWPAICVERFLRCARVGRGRAEASPREAP